MKEGWFGSEFTRHFISKTACWYYSPVTGVTYSDAPPPVIFTHRGLNLYAIAANNPVNKWDILGLLQACYRPIDGIDWQGPLALLWHAFIKFSDGSTASNTGEDSGTSNWIKCYPVKRDDKTPSCKCKTDKEIEDCIRAEAESDRTIPHWFRYNCGIWVRTKFEKCCLKDPTPWWLIY